MKVGHRQIKNEQVWPGFAAKCDCAMTRTSFTHQLITLGRHAKKLGLEQFQER